MDAEKFPLLITFSNELLNGEPILVSSNCLPVKASRYEPAGHSFHDAALKLLGLFEEEDTDIDSQSEVSDDRGHAHIPSTESYSSKGRKKSSKGSKQQDQAARSLFLVFSFRIDMLLLVDDYLAWSIRM